MARLTYLVAVTAFGTMMFMTTTGAAATDGTTIDVPEPASLSLLAVAAGAVALLRRRR